MFRSCAFLYLILLAGMTPLDLYGVGASDPSNEVLIIHDELPQMEVLAKFLRD